MQTISNIASTASTAIWGPGPQESAALPEGDEPVAGQQGLGTATDPYDKGNEEEQVKRQMAAIPAEEKPSNTGKSDIAHTEHEREAVMPNEEFPRRPSDHSGEPLKMHGAPENTQEGGSDVRGDPLPKSRSDSVAQEGGNPHGKKLGTGEQVVKASGLAADGGDFDATKPGAGKEATRLIEEQDVVRDSARDKQSDISSESSTPEKTKVSKMAKLKEKLHLKH